MKKIGTLFLALGIIAVFAGCKKPTDEIVELTKIEITTPADKLEYLVGEDLDTTDLEITATYSDETTKVVTDWTPSGYDKTKAGEQTVKITYTENEITVETSYTVTVKEVPVEPEDPSKAPENPGDSDNKDPTKEPPKEPPKVEITKIEIEAEPTQREYFVGAQELNLTGLKVTATYTDGTTADVTDKVTTTGFDSSTATDSQTITVTYEGKTATFTVKISPVLFTGISITTQPTKKDYHIGDEIDLTGMVVTANYNDGSTITLGATEYTVTGFDSSSLVENKTITVTYNEKTATFTINVVFNWYETPVQLPASIGGTYGTEGTYVLFGVWPQDGVPEEELEGLKLDETTVTTIERGYLKYVKGSDGNYYVKHESKWYYVMPIQWRVVDTSNGSENAKLLVAENILTANVPYYEDWENNRTIDGKTVYPNNYKYSQIRAYLNGYKYTGYDTTSSSNVEKAQWNNNGFLQTAFTSEAIKNILTTEVNNRGESTTDVGKNLYWANGKQADGVTDSGYIDYTCENTNDKIFLLSEYEVTKYSKSTEAYNSKGPGNSRIRVTTDYAKANNAYQSTTNGYGGYWWLRSPLYGSRLYARDVAYDGDADSYVGVDLASRGVVPALSIKLQ